MWRKKSNPPQHLCIFGFLQIWLKSMEFVVSDTFKSQDLKQRNLFWTFLETVFEKANFFRPICYKILLVRAKRKITFYFFLQTEAMDRSKTDDRACFCTLKTYTLLQIKKNMFSWKKWKKLMFFFRCLLSIGKVQNDRFLTQCQIAFVKLHKCLLSLGGNFTFFTLFPARFDEKVVFCKYRSSNARRDW